MRLHLAQQKIAIDNHRYRIVNCGRRFGKTTLAVEEIKGFALADRDNYIEKLDISQIDKKRILHISSNDEYRMRINAFAETIDDVRELLWRPLLTELKPIITYKNEQLSEIVCRNKDNNKTTIKLRSWENVEKMRGKKSDITIYDEVAKYRNFLMYKEEVLRPTLSDYIGRELYLSTPRGFNHFYDLYNLQEKDKDYKSFHFTSYDNQFLSKAEIDQAKKDMTEDRFAQEYLADFRKTEGLVYKEFDRDKHLFEKGERPEHFIEIIGGLDFGFNNPACALTIGKDKDNVYWVINEWYKSQKTDSEIADYVVTLNWQKCYADPESAGGIEELKRRKVNVRDVNKGKDSVRNGITAVTELFKTNRIRISSECINLIWELETYSYADKKPDHNEDEKPIKDNDHAMDALRYALVSEIASKSSGMKIYRPDNISRKTTVTHLQESQQSNYKVVRPVRSTNRFR